MQYLARLIGSRDGFLRSGLTTASAKVCGKVSELPDKVIISSGKGHIPSLSVFTSHNGHESKRQAVGFTASPPGSQLN